MPLLKNLSAEITVEVKSQVIHPSIFKTQQTNHLPIHTYEGKKDSMLALIIFECFEKWQEPKKKYRALDHGSVESEA